MVVLRVGNEGHSIHESHGLVVIGKAVGFFDGHVGAVALQSPALQLGQCCYYFGS